MEPDELFMRDCNPPRMIGQPIGISGHKVFLRTIMFLELSLEKTTSFFYFRNKEPVR